MNTPPPPPPLFPIPTKAKHCVTLTVAQGEPQLPAMVADFCLPPELMRDRQPVYERLLRNAYSARLRPKRMHRDDMAVCNCKPVPVPEAVEGVISREVSDESVRVSGLELISILIREPGHSVSEIRSL